jgi:hypothetical protein
MRPQEASGRKEGLQETNEGGFVLERALTILMRWLHLAW